MDDTFFNSCFDGQTDCMELLLRIVMRKPELKVIRMRTQREVPNIYGRAVRFDVFATDGKGTEYNIEVQRSDSGANPKRARFNCSMLDTMSIESGTNWEDFPPTCVIFITEHDTQGCGLPIYHVERTIRELNGKRFEDASEVIYVNATHQDKSPLGWLMHDFLCNDPAEMHYPQLAKRASFFKSDEHGVNEMCKIMEDIEKNGYKKANLPSFCAQSCGSSSATQITRTLPLTMRFPLSRSRKSPRRTTWHISHYIATFISIKDRPSIWWPVLF